MTVAAPEITSIVFDCPAHPGEHWAVMEVWPHKFAGIWECPRTGEQDIHDHQDVHIEEVEDWPVSPTDIPAAVPVYICDLDGVAIEDRDPLSEAREAAEDL